MFRENNIEFEHVNYFAEPLPAAKLRELFGKAGLSPFDAVRKKEPLYKELNISAATGADELIELIAAHPGLLQRPIVEIGDRAVLARPPEKALELIEMTIKDKY